MTIKVQKWGNSLGVRIPRKIANSLHLVSGTEVEVTVKEQTIIIKNNYSELDRLLQDINQSNIHKEQFVEEDRQGNEAWGSIYLVEEILYG